MDTIQIKDKRFTPFIPEERILKEVARVASEINRDLEGANPLFLSVLNGAFMFAADLMRNLTIPSEISFRETGLLCRNFFYRKGKRVGRFE